MFLAIPRHPDHGSAINERVLDLIGHHNDPLIGDSPEMLGIKVGQGQVSDLAFLPQLCQMSKGIQIPGIVIVPPVERDIVKSGV